MYKVETVGPVYVVSAGRGPINVLRAASFATSEVLVYSVEGHEGHGGGLVLFDTRGSASISIPLSLS